MLKKNTGHTNQYKVQQKADEKPSPKKESIRKVDVDSSPGTGTIVTVEIPI